MADTAATLCEPRCEAVLAFWFGTGADDATVIADKSALWFRGGANVDAAIRERFSTLHRVAIDAQRDSWLSLPRGCLALLVLVDQFSRNLFRGDARAFARDALARARCEDALRRGVDRALRPIERVFLYLPLEHSEVLQDQHRSVALFAALRDEVRPDLRESFNVFLDYAERHRDVIARFGRFPHRNAPIGRDSSPAELAFLAEPGASF